MQNKRIVLEKNCAFHVYVFIITKNLRSSPSEEAKSEEALISDTESVGSTDMGEFYAKQ